MMTKIDVCWVYSSALSSIGAFEKWKRFYSVDKAKAYIEKISVRKNFLFVRYIVVNGKVVEHL